MRGVRAWCALPKGVRGVGERVGVRVGGGGR